MIFPSSNAFFTAQLIDSTGEAYENYRGQALSAVSAGDGEPLLLALFDLTLHDAGGAAVQPDDPVRVRVDFGTGMNSTAGMSGWWILI